MKRIAVVLLLSAVTAKAEIVNQYVEISGLRGEDESIGPALDVSGGSIGASVEAGNIIAIRPYGEWSTTDVYGYNFNVTAYGIDLVARHKPTDNVQLELIAGAADVSAEFAILGLDESDTGTRGGFAVRYSPHDAVELYVRWLAYDAFDSNGKAATGGIMVRLAERLWLGAAATDQEDSSEMNATLRFRL